MKKRNYVFLLIQLFTSFVYSQTNLSSIENEFYEYMDSTSATFIKKYSKINNKKSLEILKNLYIKNNLAEIQKTEGTHPAISKIPKIIHQIWVGPKREPKFFKVFRKTWIKNYPDWEYKLWTNKDVEKLNLINRKLYDKTKIPREKANILRYELLYQFGGLYIDADFLCLACSKNNSSKEKAGLTFDDLNTAYDFYVGISANDGRAILNNALIASKPGHPIMEHIVKNIKSEKRGALNRSGVIYFSHELVKIIENAPGVNIAFPTNFFYSVPKFNNNFNSKKDLFKFIKPKSMALHYWASMWNRRIERLIRRLQNQNIKIDITQHKR